MLSLYIYTYYSFNSLNKYLWRAYYVSGTMVVSGNITVNKVLKYYIILMEVIPTFNLFKVKCTQVKMTVTIISA